jgi:hypothetical protein
MGWLTTSPSGKMVPSSKQESRKEGIMWNGWHFVKSDRIFIPLFILWIGSVIAVAVFG